MINIDYRKPIAKNNLAVDLSDNFINCVQNTWNLPQNFHYFPTNFTYLERRNFIFYKSVCTYLIALR